MLYMLYCEQKFREEMSLPLEHQVEVEPMKICIAVRKRPISAKEVKRHDHDSVSCSNPIVTVHDCKLRVDGISKYLDNVAFEFGTAVYISIHTALFSLAGTVYDSINALDH